MISVHVNPRGMEDEYLKCLNLCYGNWGDRRQYDWYFRRQTAYSDPDLIVLKIDGQTAAGSAVSYRRLALPNDCEIAVGIMTGAWTLPPFRGQGCFARIIEESVRLTALKEGALLLGFAVEERASFRQLARAGSALFPSSYFISTAQTQVPALACQLSRVEQSEQVTRMMYEKLKQSHRGYSHFVYSTEREFRAQFVDRPGTTEILTDRQGNFGIIEKKENTDSLQLLLSDAHEINNCLAGFLKHTLENGRRLFLYSTRPEIRRACVRLGLESKAGSLTVLIAEASLLQTALKIASPLTIMDSDALAQSGSACFIGPWEAQSGDRA